MDKSIEKEFISLSLRPRNMTFYSPRSSILRCIKEETADFYGTVLDVGCGFMPYKELIEAKGRVKHYLGLDLEQPTYYGAVEPQLKWDGQTIPLDDGSVDCVMATEFLEHHADPEKVLREMRRVLRTGGIFFGTVPFIWNLHEIPFDEYRYTPYAIERHLKNAGFVEVKIRPLGGWNLAFAQMIGLWLGFSPMSRFSREVLKLLFFPLYAILVRTDKRFEGFDGAARSMYSGLCIRARAQMS
jgi:SAM-dependent methyltransferase